MEPTRKWLECGTPVVMNLALWSENIATIWLGEAGQRPPCARSRRPCLPTALSFAAMSKATTLRLTIRSWWANFVNRSTINGFWSYSTMPSSVQFVKAESTSHLTSRRGISLVCAISPWLGGLYRHALDTCMAQTGLFYARFMDDVWQDDKVGKWIFILSPCHPLILLVNDLVYLIDKKK